MSSPNGGHGRDRDDAAPRFDHLLQLTDRRGTVDHARHAEPSPDVGGQRCPSTMLTMCLPGACTRDLAREPPSAAFIRISRRDQCASRSTPGNRVQTIARWWHASDNP